MFNSEVYLKEDFAFELTKIGEEFLKHKDPMRVLGEGGTSAFLGGLYLKDYEEGLYDNNVIELTLISDDTEYLLYVDTPEGSHIVDESDYTRERLEEVCRYYAYLIN